MCCFVIDEVRDILLEHRKVTVAFILLFFNEVDLHVVRFCRHSGGSNTTYRIPLRGE